MQSDKAFGTVSERIPDSYLGYFWRARANAALDPQTILGLAKPYYEKVIEIVTSKDDGSNNNELVEAYRYLSYYYYLSFEKSKSAEDKEHVRSYSEKILALDPENGVAKQLLEAVKQ